MWLDITIAEFDNAESPKSPRFFHHRAGARTRHGVRGENPNHGIGNRGILTHNRDSGRLPQAFGVKRELTGS